MNLELRDFFIGLFFPLVILASCSVYKYGRLLYSLLSTRSFDMKAHALWLVIVLMFAGMLWETVFYGLARSISVREYLNMTMQIELIAVPKLAYIAAATIALGAYSLITEDKKLMWRIGSLSVLAWLGASFASALWL